MLESYPIWMIITRNIIIKHIKIMITWSWRVVRKRQMSLGQELPKIIENRTRQKGGK